MALCLVCLSTRSSPSLPRSSSSLLRYSHEHHLSGESLSHPHRSSPLSDSLRGDCSSNVHSVCSSLFHSCSVSLSPLSSPSLLSTSLPFSRLDRCAQLLLVCFCVFSTVSSLAICLESSVQLNNICVRDKFEKVHSLSFTGRIYEFHRCQLRKQSSLS